MAGSSAAGERCTWSTNLVGQKVEKCVGTGADSGTPPRYKTKDRDLLGRERERTRIGNQLGPIDEECVYKTDLLGHRVKECK